MNNNSIFRMLSAYLLEDVLKIWLDKNDELFYKIPLVIKSLNFIYPNHEAL